MNERKIYLLSNFQGFLKSYSPIIVVQEQLKMFKSAGYHPVLIVADNWNPPENTIFSEVETVRTIPASVYNEPTEFSEQDLKEIDTLYEQINAALDDEAVVITHDLIFLPDYVKHNVACRRIAKERPDISWIHWVHSATSPGSLIKERSMYGEKYLELLSSKFPNSIVAFPNAYSIPRVARNFGYEEDEVVEVPHSTDPVQGMSKLTQNLYHLYNLGDADVVMIYPLRLDRGKNAEMNVRLVAALEHLGVHSELVFCDFQSTGDDKVVYREDLKNLANELNILPNVHFVSELDSTTSLEISHDVVMELFTLSNVFMMPSKSETYSLVTQEAMLRGNFCILNHDFAPFRQIFGDNAVYKQFSSNIGFDGLDGRIDTSYSDINAFFRDMAKMVNYYLQHDKVIAAKTWARKERNPDSVFANYLEPLLYRNNSNQVKEILDAEILGDHSSLQRPTE